MTETLVIHFLELSLKGRNRPWFVDRLVRSLRLLLTDQRVSHIRHVQGRIEARLGAEADWPQIRARLKGVPGIANFAKAVEVPITAGEEATRGIDDIWTVMRPMLHGRSPAGFRVKVRRVNKQFAIESPVVERALGERVVKETGWKVNLSDPALTIWVEALAAHALVYIDREPGAGGLPAGTGGKVMCLLSGGIDSPVAAWRMMRRGCTALFVHFHAYPILSIASQEKARELVKILCRRQIKARLFLVPFGQLQQQVVLAVPPALRVVIYRRFMVRIAEAIARRNHALALVTGDVIGQVASQTLENIAAVGQVSTMPILRPLVSCDKEEITAEAREIGTYETSILEDQDCCTLFTPELPSTRTTLRIVEEAEQALDVDALVAMALEGLTMELHRASFASISA